MCRLAAYLGSSLQLKHFLLDPPHNLINQSWAPKEMTEAVLNADGFGFGWYTNEGKIATYKSVQPIWSDTNINGLSESLVSQCWLANVRSATPGQATDISNTQPFTDSNIIFMHNGYIKHFNPEIKTKFHEYLFPAVQANISGNSDSEYLFAMVRQQRQSENSKLDNCLCRALTDFTSLLAEGTALLNIVMTDGQTLYVVRHAINGQCPSLYYTKQDEAYPNAFLVASECMTESEYWEAVPEHCLLILSEQNDPEYISL